MHLLKFVNFNLAHKCSIFPDTCMRTGQDAMHDRGLLNGCPARDDYILCKHFGRRPGPTKPRDGLSGLICIQTVYPKIILKITAKNTSQKRKKKQQQQKKATILTADNDK